MQVVIPLWFALSGSLLLISHLPAGSAFTQPRRIMSTSARASAPAAVSSNDEQQQQLYRHTPFIYSSPLSQLAGGRSVYLKLDLLQASGSFKDRGMAHLCRHLQTHDNIQTLISSSGGNAGLAVATIGRALNMNVKVIVPLTTKSIVVEKLQSLGAHVTVHGANWNEADALARRRVEEANAAKNGETNAANAAYISPYDHSLLWTGHSSVVDEILLQDLPNNNVSASPPAAILLSVGGGGLLCGVLEGLQRHSIATTVVAAETDGASSFAQALQAGHTVRLDAITTVATSLGALEVTPATLERTTEYQKQVAGGRVVSLTCTDAEAVQACLQFAQDHRMLVEPACGAALAMMYSERLRTPLLESLEENNNKEGLIVIEVCGGSGVTIDLLSQWKREYLE